MGVGERKGRERAEREQRIVATARVIAEREGWDAVTIRRLADEIEYSQPVLYSHFANRDAIVAAVALEGFRDIAADLLAAAGGAGGKRQALQRVASAYLAFALGRPALYEAMFVLPISLRFADPATKPEMRAGFDALSSVIAPFCVEAEAATETFWATLHGLTELERSGRIGREARDRRIQLVIQAITTAPLSDARR